MEVNLKCIHLMLNYNDMCNKLNELRNLNVEIPEQGRMDGRNDVR